MAKQNAATIEPLDKSAIAEARKKAEAKYQEQLTKELGSLLKPRQDRIAELTAANAKLATELDGNQAEIDRLADEIAEITEQPKPKAKGAKGGGGGKRERRSEDDLKADAQKIVDLLKLKGKQGASGAEVAAAAKLKAGMKLTDFVKQYAGVQLKKDGDRGANVRYTLA